MINPIAHSVCLNAEIWALIYKNHFKCGSTVNWELSLGLKPNKYTRGKLSRDILTFFQKNNDSTNVCITTQPLNQLNGASVVLICQACVRSVVNSDHWTLTILTGSSNVWPSELDIRMAERIRL